MMANLILIYANCDHKTARGDFVFAANIAVSACKALEEMSNADIQVCLVSTIDGVERFKAIFPSPDESTVLVEDTELKLYPITAIDPSKDNVLSFIDANPCKPLASDWLKSILSPSTKLLIIDNINRFTPDIFTPKKRREKLDSRFIGIYPDFIDESNLSYACAGFDECSYGIPNISYYSKLDESESEFGSTVSMPEDNYGFLYLSNVGGYSDIKLMAQYTKLCQQPRYILVGNYEGSEEDIQIAREHDQTLTMVDGTETPEISIHPSMEKKLMRKKMAESSQVLVATTGVTSTLEAFRDAKLSFYQYQDNNRGFVQTYLSNIGNVISSEASPSVSENAINLAHLLFEPKPLSRKQMSTTYELLQSTEAVACLIHANQLLMDKASGRMGYEVIRFVLSPAASKISMLADDDVHDAAARSPH